MCTVEIEKKMMISETSSFFTCDIIVIITTIFIFFIHKFWTIKFNGNGTLFFAGFTHSRGKNVTLFMSNFGKKVQRKKFVNHSTTRNSFWWFKEILKRNLTWLTRLAMRIKNGDKKKYSGNYWSRKKWKWRKNRRGITCFCSFSRFFFFCNLNLPHSLFVP